MTWQLRRTLDLWRRRRRAVAIRRRLYGEGPAAAVVAGVYEARPVTHLCPDSTGAPTPCCGRIAADLPLGDWLTLYPDRVTCDQPIPGWEATR